MPAAKSPLVPALTSALALLQLVADPADFAAAIPILRARMKLTPDKIALILARVLNPEEFIKKGEEVTLRGLHEETLKNYKEEKLLPEFIGAESIPMR